MIGSFQQKLESIQHNAALPITGAIRGTSIEKIYSELERKLVLNIILASLQHKCWYIKLFLINYSTVCQLKILYMY